MGAGREPVEDPLDTVHRLRALVVELHLLGAEFARTHGLHATDLRALICLLDAERSGREATPTWLREQLHLNSASVTALIDRMERSGHVRRQRDDRDRRRVLIHVTPEAVQLGQSFFGPVIANATTAIGTYSAGQLQTIDSFLADMHRAIDDARTSPGDQAAVAQMQRVRD
ncbi:MAG: MarR family transcriptional regulator [Rhodococcus sp.]|uniref:MarR family winged helix-turn-helix transcriptional regulator n=1 Tax=Rhodococcus sp. TaxID=1831 RepID=UPI001698E0EC|nr:MarR family transcriptional regulator [Rhodococcus sp. (in: high G+C Gram-positive bacteria)]NLV79992.1 MarR family transcriptional regulator [Rhodococcus sp. (in: high G+C Gram-positive bacteria)]